MNKSNGGIIYEIYSNFRFLPLLIRISIFLTLIAFIFIVVIYFSIFRKRIDGAVYDRRFSKINKQVTDLITNEVILNPGITDEFDIDTVTFNQEEVAKCNYKKVWARMMMIDIFLQYRKNFAGEIGEVLKKLFIEMELDKDLFERFKSRQWDFKIKALYSLTDMDIPISDVTILPLTNSGKYELRTAARKAYVQLSKNEPFKFFDVATEPLFPWDQIELFKIITSNPTISIPNFSRWVNYSANKSVISFCLKLIAYYNQQNAVPAILKLLETPDHELRGEAINCLGKLGETETEDTIIDLYNYQPLNCQIEILRAIGNINSGKHIEFLKHEFLFSTNFEIRMNAAKAITKHKTEAPVIIQELMSMSNEENQLILKHVTNPLIKF